MQIKINGEAAEVEEAIPMAALIATLALTGKRIAVELNGELVPRSRFDRQLLGAGDRVEIIQAVGGG
ncbi:sulfur carrier protein ThiS [Candidatus Thiodictyon syntrophicum]|jgi:sulfur carrier protein|uniref:Thiamine biosynthesis protein ThiS n=1 Tax=Candidatus Thiodictyon syntrophicum TaxID=1166950 RepID=A0A2K8U2L5_9GAMM|nr:sulfur carrier protein ThiS [Candidatus Thiodictyon syntrophicum]AUB79824.1 thiamine biosynthesis protein ThiS [Candidatus Thiodictyon syntrophicum]